MTLLADIGITPTAEDNVAVALRRLEPGTVLPLPGGEVVMAHTVPEGHRFAIRDVAPGEHLLSWGRPFAVATRRLAAGDYVLSERMAQVLHTRQAQGSFPEANVADRDLAPVDLDETTFHPGTQVLAVDDDRTFLGYDRGPGLGVGTRNHIVLVATSSRTGAFVEALARRLGDVGRGVAGMDPLVSVVHTEGGRRRLTHNRELVLRTLAGYAVHPNVGAMLAVDEAGGGLSNADLQAYLREHDYPQTGRPRAYLTREGSVEEDLRRAEELVRDWVPRVVAERTRQPVSALSLALQCGGSDAFSGITANPLAGAVARELVRRGGSAILAETDELIGAEEYVLSRARDAEVARRFLTAVEGFKEQVRRHGHTAETNVSGGNLWRGLYNISIKSLGAARKLDPQVRLDHVLDYADRLDGHGYAFMDSPGNDLESIAGEVATGANLIFFTTGNGSVTNFPFVPTVKLVSTTGRYRMLPSEMDVDAGRLLTGTDVEDLTTEVLDLSLAVASGQRTAGERAGHSQVSLWREWQRGPGEDPAAPQEALEEQVVDGRPLAVSGPAPDPELVSVLADWVVPRDIGLVMPTSICSGQVARQIATRLEPSGYGGSRHFAAPVHTEGCGASSGASEQLFGRIVLGHVRHPRVRHALLLEHGCEKTHNAYFRERMQESGLAEDAYGWASIQLDGGIEAVGDKVEGWFAGRPAEGCSSAAQPPRREAPVLGLHAVGPVATAGATALGRLARGAVEAGGSVVVMDGSSLTEAPAFRQALGVDALPPTIRHGAGPETPGLHVMAGPGEDWLEALAALVAGGASAVVAHVSEVTVPGHPFVPVVQVSADPATVRRRGQDLDVALSQESAEEPAGVRDLAALTVMAASGRHETVTQRTGLVGFQVSRGLLGVSM